MFAEKPNLVCYEDVISKNNLQKGFRQAKRKNYFPGADGVDCRKIQDIVFYMDHLRTCLENKTYCVKPVKHQTTDSFDGKKKIDFEVCCFSDRVIEYCIKNKLQENIVFSPYTCGYIGKGGTKKFYKIIDMFRESDIEYFASFDIKDFFKNIRKSVLLLELEEFLDKDTLSLLDRLVFRDQKLNLPLGHVLSPFLSNVYLKSTDEYLRNYTVVRFADNYVFAIKNKKEADTIQFELDQLLERKYLNLNHTKNKIYHKSDILNIT
jgi:retron-type reverse transcriptase